MLDRYCARVSPKGDQRKRTNQDELAYYGFQAATTSSYNKLDSTGKWYGVCSAKRHVLFESRVSDLGRESITLQPKF
jgi:hypothetical protein